MIFARLFKPFRSQDESKALIGREFVIQGQRYRVTSHNDLGCLYGVKLNGSRVGKREYVLDPLP